MEERVIEKNNCTGCGACYNICPKKAIEMKENEEGFLYPCIDTDKCTKCNLCRNTCPVINKKLNENQMPKAIAAYIKNKQERMNSSSGGVFYELAKYFIEQGGVVIGAGYNKKMEVIHKDIYSIDEIKLLQGSKYVQSNTLDIFKQVKKILTQKRKVLFVGTPCQVAGLKAYLRDKDENLYTCDLVCHGAPSPKVWKKYLNEKQKNDRIIDYAFRDKLKGWNNFGIKIVYNTGNKEYIDSCKDEFFKVFMKNYSLRDTCYNCKFSKLPREADISLGDFWGVEGLYKEFADNKGTSLVLINNSKGEEIFRKISCNLFYKENCDIEYATKCNPCINSSVLEPKRRNEFFNDLERMNLKKLEKKYIPKENGILKRIFYKLRMLQKRK